MLTLAIETATAACSVAMIAEDGRVAAERHEIVGRGHAERLVPAIGELLAETGETPGAILVDCGPGSFTGVRVGLAAAKGLALGWGVPVHGFSSLALLATAGNSAGEIAAAIPGGHGEIFVQRFSGPPWREAGPLVSLRPEDAAAAFPDGPVVGPGAAALIAARGSGEPQDIAPRAARAMRLPPALRQLPATPIYGRAPDAKLPA